MAIEFAKAYKNFQKFEQQKEMSRSSADNARASSGLLAPRANRRTEQASGNSELDKIAGYVQQIRKHRMKYRNGE